MDVWTALVSGLAAQQNANDPGGDRWVRLADGCIDMFLEHWAPGGPGASNRQRGEKERS